MRLKPPRKTKPTDSAFLNKILRKPPPLKSWEKPPRLRLMMKSHPSRIFSANSGNAILKARIRRKEMEKAERFMANHWVNLSV